MPTDPQPAPTPLAHTPTPETLEQLAAEGWITRRKHPWLDLWICNYTPKTAYSGNWTEDTMVCRGLIVDGDGAVVQRPFRKFFNLGQEGTEWLDEPFEVFDKLDGSLGILYWGTEGPALASRGAFGSQQAFEGTDILRERYRHTFEHLDPSLTYLFEIIYPDNRIVVDYGDRRDVVLLAVLDTATGRDLPLYQFAHLFPTATRYDGLGLTELQLAQLDQANREGYVVRFDSGLRVKVKLSEYVRLHRFVAGINERHIWEALRDGTLDNLLAGAPPHYLTWAHQRAEELRVAFATIEGQCRRDFRVLDSRRETAEHFKTCPFPQVLFLMLDERPYDGAIWRLLRPHAAQPFRAEE